MKILHIFHNADLVNGVDRTTLTLLRALQGQGVEVLALVPQAGDVTQALDEAGVAYFVSDLRCCRGPAKMAEFAYLGRAAVRTGEIEAWIRQGRVDLVHLNTGHLIDGAVAAARAGAASIWHIHSPFEIDLQRYSGFMDPEGYAWLLGELGSHVIAVSDDVRNSLLPWLPSARVSTLYNGIDVEDLEQRARPTHSGIREELGLPAGTPLVLGVGRISAQKDFATFARVARKVVNTNPSVCFAIVGPAEDKPLAETLYRQIAEFELTRRVFVLGPRSDVPCLLAQCNAFLSTAIFEGHPLTSLEAMAMGKPVVAMDCVGLRECIRHEVDGLLVPLGDEHACAQAVLRVLEEVGLAENLGVRGRQSVLDRYSAAAYASGFLDIAEGALAGYRPGQKAAAASFTLGLLAEIDEAHDRLVGSKERPRGMLARIRPRLAELINRMR